MSEAKTILLVDGHALIHRGFHALPHLTSRTGQPTGAVFGFARLLLAALKLVAPEYIAVAFDSRGPTFRHAEFAAYKAHRAAPPDEMISQIPLVRELVTAFSIPQFVLPGFEADDLIATLATQAERKGLIVMILTGDRDLVQLVNDRVSLVAPKKGVSDPLIYTPRTVQQQYGFAPTKMVFFKALAGDSSDNIPGLKGIGAVTATRLVKRFDSLDDLYRYLKTGKKIPELSPRLQQKIKEGEASARLSEQLATVQRDLPVKLKPRACAVHDYDRDKVVDLLVKLDFRSLLKELPGAKEATGAATGVADQPPLTGSAKTAGRPAAASGTESRPAATGPASELDRQLAQVLRAIEKKGVRVDVVQLKQLTAKWEKELATLTAKIHRLAGTSFNLDSSRQLADILFNTLKLPTSGIKELTSGYSTDANQLALLADKHPIVPLVLEYRELTKLLSTYTRPLPTMTDRNNRLHTSYNTATATGRIASKNPNLQNIPIRTARGKQIREAFIAAPGHTLIAADYSQIELRVAAHLSKDPVMLAAFRAGADIHAATSQEMGVDRRTAKVINFSILYGKGPHSFAQDLGIDIAEAKEYIARYFATYRGLARWMEETLRFVGAHGYAQTLFGWRRPFPAWRGRRVSRLSRWGREAINLPVQGTAAEILKRAMVALGKEKGLADTMVLTVHDELVFEVPTGRAATLTPTIKNIMEETTKLDVPVVVDIATGPSWGKLKE